VLAYAVSQRRRELAIRAALGAQRHKLLSTLMGETAWMAVGGIAIGVPAALWARSAIQALLFNAAHPTAPTLTAAIAVMVAATVVAALAPSRDVLKNALVEALRQD
jgi:ABC-type antimicrobial peptide transport system permease subunit